MEWINVKDALPDEGLNVLCHDGGKFVVGKIITTDEGWLICESEFDNVTIKTHSVSHWAKIPPPPFS